MRKALFTILYSISSLLVMCQVNVCKEIIDTTDAFDGRKTSAIIPVSLKGNNSISGFVSEKIFSISINAPKVIGVDENSEITFLFTDGQKQIYKHSSSLNYKGDFVIAFFNYKKYDMIFLEKFLKLKLKGIRLTGLTTTETIMLDDDNAEYVNQLFNCLYLKYNRQ